MGRTALLFGAHSSDEGVTCDQHAKAANGNPGRRELPVWKWAVDADGVIGVHDERRTLTGAALAELLIRRILDSSHA